MSWFIAGILSVASMTTTLASFGNLVEDRANKTYMDFYSSPISRARLLVAIFSVHCFVGFIMCLFTFIAAECFPFCDREAMLPFNKMLEVAGVILLAVLASASMVLLLVSFFKTSNAFAAASTVIRNTSWFSSRYLHSNRYPTRLHSNGRENLPVSHSAALFRQIINGNTSNLMLFQMLR